jgi:hypothetical protein
VLERVHELADRRGALADVVAVLRPRERVGAADGRVRRVADALVGVHADALAVRALDERRLGRRRRVGEARTLGLASTAGTDHERRGAEDQEAEHDAESELHARGHACPA